MSKNKRRRFSADFKAKVALEALKGEQTLSELAARVDLHPNMIAQWKRQATEGMADVFSSKGSKRKEVGEAQIKELHAKIGQLTIERDFLCGPTSTIFVRRPFPIRARSTKYRSLVQKTPFFGRCSNSHRAPASFYATEY